MLGKLKEIRAKRIRENNLKNEKKVKKTRAGMLLHIMRKKYGDSGFVLYPTRSMSILPSPAHVKNAHVTYPLIRPYAYANIKYDKEENMMIYDVIEPVLNEKERKTMEKIKEGLVQIIDISLEDIKKGEVLKFLEEAVNTLIDEYGFDVSRKEYMKIMYYIYRDFIGLNRLEALMHDAYIEDIGVDGTGLPVYVVHKKFGSMKTNIVYEDIEELREFVTKLAERSGRYISYAEPLLDGTLTDGTRVQASLASDVTTRGPTFSLRKFREVPLTPIDLIRLNSLSPEMLAYLWFVVEEGANILIAGGVSTGKTSLLNAISMFIPESSKIVSIEDTRELQLPHENWLPGVTRSGFTGSDVGEITMYELLRESFRQNPDYLIVGEIRGKEAYVMFQGMASGHPSISTMHAGNVDDLMKRLQTKPINLSPGLLESLDLVIVLVHAMERGKSARRVKDIVEIESVDMRTGQPRILKSFSWMPHTDTFEYRGSSWLLGKISAQKGLSMSYIHKELARRTRFIIWMYQNNISAEDQARFINIYYSSPAETDKLVSEHASPEELKAI